MQFLSTISYQMWRVKSRFWNIVLSGKKRYYTFNPFFFAALWICQKCHHDLRLQESSPHLLRNGGCFSLMTNMQIIGSIVYSPSPVSEKTCLHSPSHLCASKRSHVCLFMLNTMIEMACTNAHFRAEWRKRDPFFVRGDIFAHGTWNPHFWSK